MTGKGNDCKIKTQNLNKLSIFHQNIQHLASRIEILQLSLFEIKPDIVVVSEHKLRSGNVDSLNLENFSVCSMYCRTESCGGGVY